MMNAARSDEAAVQALRGVALDPQELADLRRLYEAPAGIEYAPDAGERPSGRLVRRCTALGRRLGKSMGRPTRSGRDLIGYCDPATGTWRMRPQFRLLMREVGWAQDSGASTLVEELDQLDDFDAIEVVSALISRQEDAIRCSECLGEAHRDDLLRSRFGQGRFRAAVGAFEEGCRVSGVGQADLLQAAHMKPWFACSNRERLDGANGLLLTPTFHLLFSKGYISFDRGGRLLVSGRLPARIVQGWSVEQRAEPRRFVPRQLEYLEDHLSRLFKA